MQVSAIVVTRGDVDLARVRRSLWQFDEIIVWDNREREDLQVLGRYRAVLEARHALLYTQDDDCLVDAGFIVKQHEPGVVVCNMPLAKRAEYRALAPEVALVGWGACFERRAVDVLLRYVERFGQDELLLRECDRVFTALNRKKLVSVPVVHLEHAHAGRMGNEPRHLADLAEIRARIATL